jgi:hypothetical protein
MKSDDAIIYLGFDLADSPLGDVLVDKNGVACFKSDADPPADIVADLTAISWGECAYGAMDCKIYPFYAESNKASNLTMAVEILEHLKAASFKSDHIHNLNCDHIDFPGYHSGTINDEIHNDENEQCIFSKAKDSKASDDGSLSFNNHRKLKEKVVEGKLWYVLLHSKENGYGDFVRDYVALFAVGKSKMDDCLIGVVTHQVCHNLCD